MYGGGCVAYQDSGLAQVLIAELGAWDTSYCDGCGNNGQWQSDLKRDAFRAEGRRLVGRVAEALGRDFAVRFDDHTVRSRRGPGNPAAAAAFRAHGAKRVAAMLEGFQQAHGRGDSRCDDTRFGERLAEPPGQWLREARSGTVKRVRLLLSPDFSVGFPVEVVVDGEAGYVDADMLGISDSLRRDLEAFQEWWDEHADVDEDDDTAEDLEWEVWRRTGSGLLQRLQSELGEDYFVTWAGTSTS
jgi:hypothetical protein